MLFTQYNNNNNNKLPTIEQFQQKRTACIFLLHVLNNDNNDLKNILQERKRKDNVSHKEKGNLQQHKYKIKSLPYRKANWNIQT